MDYGLEKKGSWDHEWGCEQGRGIVNERIRILRFLLRQESSRGEPV